MNMATDSEKFFLIVARLVFIMQSMQILMRHDPYYLTLLFCLVFILQYQCALYQTPYFPSSI